MSGALRESPGAPLLAIEAVSRRFGDVVAVDGVSLEIAAGEFVSLLGPSGCGKTTLLRMVAGFERPDAGRILLDGRDMTAVPPYARPVNMMFQSYALFPHLTVRANVGFGLREAGWPRPRIAARVAEMLALLRIEELAERKPHQLSGGQQQRVALARALAQAPSLLLLDEPLSALDRGLREAMRAELKNLQRRIGIAFLMVTHDQEEAMGLSTRIGVMRAGRLEQIGPPAELYERPANRFVAGFLGASNLFEGRVEGRVDGLVRVHVPALGGAIELAAGARACDGRLAPGATVAVGIRPERLRVGPTAGEVERRLAGLVEGTTYLGGALDLDVVLDTGAAVQARLADAGDGLPRIEAGARVELGWTPGSLVLLPPE